MILFFLSSGLFLGWSLGANDAANVFGTAVGTKISMLDANQPLEAVKDRLGHKSIKSTEIYAKILAALSFCGQYSANTKNEKMQSRRNSLGGCRRQHPGMKWKPYRSR